MFTSNIKKRITTVAITAVTAGFISVVSVAPANAAVVVSHEYGTLILANGSSISGSAVPFANAATTDVNTMRSVGWVLDTSATVNATAGGNFVNASGTKTASVLPGAQIAFLAKGSGSTGEGTTVTVTGGAMSSLVATNGGGASGGASAGNLHGVTAYALTEAMVSTGATTVTIDNDGAEVIAGTFTVTGAVGTTATIAIYSGDSIQGLGSSTAGTYLGGYVLTIVAAGTTGVYNAGNSYSYQQACMNNATTGTSGVLKFNTTSRCADGAVGVVYVNLQDAYEVALNSGTLTASVSGGLVVGSQASTTGSIINSASAAFSTLTMTGGQAWFYAKQPTANTAGSSTMTITYNGTPIGTFTINWAGTVTSLVVNSASCGIFSTNQLTDTQEGNVGDACVNYTAKDAAGNAVTLAAQPAVEAATGALIGATTSTLTASAGYAVVQSSSVGYGVTTLLIPNNSLSGASTYQLSLTNGALVKVKSNVVNVTVSRGTTNSFTASWDKASYNFGDIATMTITLKDLYGNLMANGTPLTGLDLSVNSGGFAPIGSTCTAATTVGGVIPGAVTCKYSVLNTEGAYAFSADLTTVTPQDASIGTLPIKSSSTVVSNADVLKSIVALIASINKQIQALQKLILKR